MKFLININSLHGTPQGKNWLKNQLMYINSITIESTTDAYYNHTAKKIYFSPDERGMENLVHEYGHHIFDMIGVDSASIIKIFKKEISDAEAEKIKSLNFDSYKEAALYEIVTDSYGIYYGFQNGYCHEIGYPTKNIPTELFAECLTAFFFDPHRINIAKWYFPKTINRIMRLITRLFK